MSQYVGDAAAALQRLLTERRFLSERSTDMDAYQRWGQGSDPGFEADFARLGNPAERKRRLNQAFRQGIADLRERDSNAAVALAQAHQALLTQCIESGGEDTTAIFVAQQELAGWRAVEAGEADIVAQNSHFIDYDPALFEAFFGFRPVWPIA